MEAGDAVRDLLRMAASRTEMPVNRKVAVQALGHVGDERATGSLIALSQDADLRLECLTALASIGDSEAILHLKDLDEKLRDDDESAAELRWHLRHLLGPDFRKQLALEQAARRKKWRPRQAP